LKIGYSTEAEAQNLFSLNAATYFKVEAAKRLLYYFPRESSELISQTILSFDVTDPQLEKPQRKGFDRYDRDLLNKVYVQRYIRSVAWSQDPQIKSAIKSIFLKTNDIEIFISALHNFQDKDHEIVQARIVEFLANLREEDYDGFGVGYNLLAALIYFRAEKSADLFRKLLKDAKPERCVTIIKALQTNHGNWTREFLVPLLDDKRDLQGRRYPIEEDGWFKKTLRVCDFAADALASEDAELKFSMYGTPEALDVKIKAMKEQLKKK
jgi:hypothetical protein